jgi:hypothetical protein
MRIYTLYENKKHKNLYISNASHSKFSAFYTSMKKRILKALILNFWFLCLSPFCLQTPISFWIDKNEKNCIFKINQLIS